MSDGSLVLKHFLLAEKGSDDFGHRARVLAICGWDVKLLPENKMGPLVRWNSLTNRAENVDRAIIKCRLCGSKAGLWKFKEASEKSLKKGKVKVSDSCHNFDLSLHSLPFSD